MNLEGNLSMQNSGEGRFVRKEESWGKGGGQKNNGQKGSWKFHSTARRKKSRRQQKGKSKRVMEWVGAFRGWQRKPGKEANG